MALTGSTEAWTDSVNNLYQLYHVKIGIIMIGNLRWESVGDDAPEPDERDMVSVHRANLGQ